MRTDTIPVGGMMCGHCQITVQDAARKLPGVRRAKASKWRRRMRVEYDPDQVSLARIVEAVRQTGYDAALPGEGRDG